MAEGALSNVTEHMAGSELDFDAAAGFSQIFVVDVEEFDEDGGTLQIGAETYSYTVPEDSDSQIDLTTPLLTDHTAGEQVLQSPSLIERIAWIQDTEQEEELKARIPHALFDAIPLGARNGDSEVVEYDFRGEEIVVLDVLGREPLRDGSFIDPTTLPPPGTDGNPPTTSPTPTVRGGIGALVVQWGAVGNNDPITYEVHVSASSGFLPRYGPPTDLGPSTYAGETGGTLIFLRTLPGTTTPFDYDTVYYVRLVAKDADGKAGPSPEASGSPAQADSPDIAVNAILAGHILAGEITAEKLAAVLIISNAIKTAEDGQRVELDSRGIRLVSQAEDTLVELPTDPGASASFAGSIVANALTVLDRLTIQGANNVVDSGGVVTVSSSLSTPGTAPVVTIANDGFPLQGISEGDFLTNRGLFYEPIGVNGTPAVLSATVVNGTIIVYEHDAVTGDMQGTGIILPPLGTQMNWNRVCGVTRRGTVIYVLGWRGAAELVVTRLRAGTFAKLSEHVITAPHQADKYRSTISTIGSSVYVWGFTGTSPSEQIERHEFTDSESNLGAWTYVGVDNYAGLTFDGRAGGHVLEGHVRVGAQDWIAHNRDQVHGANSFATATRAFEDETGWVGGAWGIAHDGTGFLSRTVNHVINHTEWDWADNKAYLVYAYTWRDNTFGYETLTSPPKGLNVRPDGPGHRAYRRNRVKITLPAFPGSVDRFRIYMGHSTTPTLAAGSLHRQGTPAYVSSLTASPSYQTDEDAAGIAPPPTPPWTPWPGATSKIQSQTPSWELSGSDAKGLLGLTSVTARKVNFGTGTISLSSVQTATATVAHGLGVTPQTVVATINDASNVGLIRTSGWGTTNFTVQIANRDNASYGAGVSIGYAWLAIG